MKCEPGCRLLELKVINEILSEMLVSRTSCKVVEENHYPLAFNCNPFLENDPSIITEGDRVYLLFFKRILTEGGNEPPI